MDDPRVHVDPPSTLPPGPVRPKPAQVKPARAKPARAKPVRAKPVPGVAAGPRRWVKTLAVGAVLASVVLTGCAAEDPLAAQARAGDNKNYIAGDGSVAEYSPDARGEPVNVQGTLFDGTTVNSTDWVGDVVVLNVWYAACGPCRAEAPTLATLSTRFAPEGVRFYGINVRDEKPTADAFERTFGITYPSFEDRDGQLLLSLTDYVPPQAVPTTLVLDRNGRVAARILGIAEETTLRTLITDALAQPAPGQLPPSPSEAAKPSPTSGPADSPESGAAGNAGDAGGKTSDET